MNVDSSANLDTCRIGSISRSTHQPRMSRYYRARGLVFSAYETLSSELCSARGSARSPVLSHTMRSMSHHWQTVTGHGPDGDTAQTEACIPTRAKAHIKDLPISTRDCSRIDDDTYIRYRLRLKAAHVLHCHCDSIGAVWKRWDSATKFAEPRNTWN